MDERFIPLREWLLPAQAISHPVSSEAVSVCAEPELDVDEEFPQYDGLDEAFADVRRFRAALADALEWKTQAILREIACDVVGRELERGIDVPALVARAVERYGALPLRVRVNENDMSAACAAGYEVVADAMLRAGDVVLELACGSIDARLGTRLERVLAEAL